MQYSGYLSLLQEVDSTGFRVDLLERESVRVLEAARNGREIATTEMVVVSQRLVANEKRNTLSVRHKGVRSNS